MPNKKISQLDQITSVAGTEVVPVVQGGVVKRTTTGAFTGRLKELARAANATAIQDAKEVGRSTLIDGLSAGAVMQQDLKAVSTALHRSPNAVTAMFVYDTSKDSDGGAWTKRCQHTSWYNEPLAGRWLGAQVDETSARYSNATLGSELISNGDFAAGGTGWTAPSHWTFTNNRAEKVSGSDGELSQAISATSGKLYKISWDQKTNGSFALRFGGSAGNTLIASGTKSFVTYAVLSGTAFIRFEQSGTLAGDWIDNVSVKEVTVINTTSNDYYQLTTDGKFYRLYKNLFQRSNEFTNAVWGKSGVSVSLTTATSAPDGTQTASKIVPGASNQQAISQYVSAGQYTLSVYAKAGEYNLLSLGAYDTAWRMQAIFNLTTGAISSNSNGVAAIQSIGNGWYRCSVTGTTTATAPFRIQVTNSAADGTATFAGNGVDGLYIWGAQLEYGSIATAYEHKVAAATNAEIFRGNKAEFPSLVGIVAEATNVTLYDLTEAGMPMWMRFSSGGQSFNYVLSAAAGNTPNVTSLSASNGLFVIGGAADNGSPFVDLIKDNIKLYSQSIPISPNIKTVSGRNNTLGRAYNCPPSDAYLGISRQNNSVSTAVLPNTPVDAATGLQLPSTAIATGGGISLVKNGTTIYNSTQTLSFEKVYLTPKVLIASRTGDSTLYYYPNPANISANFTLLTEAAGAVDFNQGNTTALALENRSEFARSSGSKIQLLKHNETTVAKGAAATITPTYNTGYMVGDIKRSYLTSVAPGTVSSTAFAARSLFLDDTTKGIWLDPSDLGTMFQDTTATIPVTGVEQQVRLILDKSKGLALGPELIDNGNFSTSNLSAWSTYNTSISVVDGEMLVNVTGSNAKVWRTITCVVGKTYKITAKARPQNGAQVWLYIGSSTEQTEDFNSGQGTTSRTISAIFTAGRVTEYITLRSQATGQVYWDDISVKELPGNHATAPSDAARPTLSARYNLLTKTEAFDDAVWTKQNMLPFGSGSIANTTETTDPIGGNTADKLVPDATNGPHRAYQVSGTASNKMSFRVKPAGYYKVAIVGASTGRYASFNLQTQSVLDSFQVVAGSPSVVSIGNGWYEISVVINGSDNYQSVNILPNSYVSGDPYATNAFSGDGTSGIYIWGASLVPADQAGLPYQRVNTANDYDSDATKFPKYLKFSGAQSLQTNSIDFSYTNSVFVSTGVRKLMTSGVGIVAETSSNADITNGAFNVAAPVSSEDYYASHRNGGILAVRGIDEPALLSPVSNVFTTVFGLTGVNSTEIGLRINGIPKTTFSRTEGTASSGFYGSHPLFIGSRNNSQHFFNGQISQLLIAGRAVTDKQIQDAENYIEQKTYGTYPEFLVDASGNQVVDALGNPLYANVTYQY